jgi:thiamine pyrophosphokinase
MKVVIISGGKPPSQKLLNEELKASDMVIAADSGADCLYDYKINPDILVGDFDSINKRVFTNYVDSKNKIEKYPVEKDSTDTQLAINKAIDSGASEIILLGCTGNRIDHLLGNIGMLQHCLDKGVKAQIIDENNIIFLIDHTIKLKGNQGDIFSIQSYGRSVENVSITGSKYKLKNYTLNVGDPLTISNEFKEEEVTISFDKGLILVLLSKD